MRVALWPRDQRGPSLGGSRVLPPTPPTLLLSPPLCPPLWPCGHRILTQGSEMVPVWISTLPPKLPVSALPRKVLSRLSEFCYNTSASWGHIMLEYWGQLVFSFWTLSPGLQSWDWEWRIMGIGQVGKQRRPALKPCPTKQIREKIPKFHGQTWMDGRMDGFR